MKKRCTPGMALLLHTFLVTNAWSTRPEPFSLTNNLFRMQNVRYQSMVSAPLAPASLTQSHIMEADARNPLEDAIRFDKVGDDKESDGSALYTLRFLAKGRNIFLQKGESGPIASRMEDQAATAIDPSFLWHITLLEGKQVIQISSASAGEPRISDASSAENTQYLALRPTGDEEGRMGYVLGKAERNATLWRLHPLYPWEGDTDFLKILRDFGSLLEIIHQASLKESKDVSCIEISPSASLPGVGLSFHTKPHQVVNMYEGAGGCVEEIRKLPPFTEVNDGPNPYSYKFTKTFTQKSTFDVSVSRTLGDSRSAEEGHFMGRGAMHNENATQEIVRNFQDRQMRAVNTALSLNMIERSSEGVSKSATARDCNAARSAQSRRRGDAARHASVVSLGTETTVGLLGSSTAIKFGAQYTGERTKTSESFTESAHDRMTDRSSINASQRHKEEEKAEKKDKAQTDEATRRRGGEERHTVGNTQQVSEDRNHNTSTRMEASVNLINKEVSHHGGEETVSVERCVTQSPYSRMHFQVTERCFNAVAFAYDVPIAVSGNVGFNFESSHAPLSIQVPHDDLRDFLKGSTWVSSIESIFKTMRAPGFTMNPETGVLEYAVKMCITLRHPMETFTTVWESSLVSEEDDARERIDETKSTRRVTFASGRESPLVSEEDDARERIDETKSTSRVTFASGHES